MFKKFFIDNAQKKVNRRDPKVHITLGMELPIPSAKEIAAMAPRIAAVTAMEPALKEKPDEWFRQRTVELRAQIQERLSRAPDPDDKKLINQILDEIMVEAYAMVREAAVRTIGLRHYDVQVFGGMVLQNCGIAEMATGEGKTLVSTLPAYLNALVGRGVHVITVNDYLARRDREWMGPVHEFLGLTVGVIQNSMTPSERRKQYGADITYGTNNEFGFDYLRDNMVMSRQEMVQRGHFYAIVDEVDSILVDEARTPLIISGAVDDWTDKYYAAQKVSSRLNGRRILERDEIDAKHKGIDLEEGHDYLADEKSNSITMTEQGMQKAEQILGISDIYSDIESQWPHFITQSLRAKEFYQRDHHYIVKDGKVIIVDEFTGRLMPGRRWSDGLHQAIEAKEGIRIQEESQTLATITLQNYFKMYTKLAGMTGTAYTEAGELKHIYDLDVVVIPTNRPLRRVNSPDRIYKNQKGKFECVVREIVEMHRAGRPVLVGTSSIEKSELLSAMLKRQGVEHQVLNAKYHEQEAFIVAQAGRLGRITIATNMAGRGTDIILGGNPEFLARADLRLNGIDVHDERYPEEYAELYAQYKQQLAEEQKKVIELGGLHVIGTERHEARRIDNQLRGRSGRQGDPGSSVFFISLEDDLMRLFGSDRIMMMMEHFGFQDDEPIEHPLINRSLETAQRRVEAHNFEIRRQLLDFDNIMNRQRVVVYDKRREIIDGRDLREEIVDMAREVIESYLEPVYASDLEEPEVEQEKLANTMYLKFGVEPETVRGLFADRSREEMAEVLFELVKERYEEKEQRLGSDRMRFLERLVYLQVIDARWKEHLLVLDGLKEGIHLRSYGQRNPIDEYRSESFHAFMEMLFSIKDGVTDMVFKAEIRESAPVRGVFSGARQQASHQEFSSLGESPAPEAQAAPAAPAPVVNSGAKVGRNDPCPCGSGKKYKKCCGS
jgi:preprotein translocase subunit SecA